MRRRLWIPFVVVVAAIAWLELGPLAIRERARRWSWDQAPASRYRRDPRRGLVRIEWPGPIQSDSRMTLHLVANEVLGRGPDERLLERRLDEAGLVAQHARVLPWGMLGMEQRLRELESLRDTTIVLAVGSGDLARLDPQADATGRLPRDPNWLRVLFGIRMLAGGPERIDLGDKPGFFPRDLWPYRRGGAPQEKTAATRFEKLLGDFVSRARTRGCRVAIAWTPNLLETEDLELSRLHAELALDGEDLEVKRPQRRVRDACSVVGVAWIDIGTALARKESAKAFDGVHGLRATYSNKAREAVARSLALGLSRALRK